MPELSSELPADWRPIVNRLQFEIRLGWFWNSFYLWFISGITLGAILTWTLRSGEVSVAPGVLSGGALMVVGALMSFDSLRRRSVTLSDALSRLDDGWRLGQSLMRAYGMGGPWPVPPSPRPALPVQVNTRVWGVPFLFVLSCIGLSMWIPPAIRPVVITPAKIQPPAWTDVEQMLEVLEEDIVEPETLDDLKSALETLRQSPEAEWYQQSGLEATDRLKEQVRSQSQQLMDGMNQIATLMEQAQMAKQGLGKQEGIDQKLQEMLGQMSENPLSLTAEQLKQLQNLDLQNLQTLDAEMLQQIEAQLRSQCQSMEAGLIACGLIGQFPTTNPGPDGGGPQDLGLVDASSIGWGQMPVLLEFNPEAKMDVGDQLEEREIEHEEAVEFLTRRAGKVSSEGDGGSAVWRQELVPAEQNVLQQFFDSNPDVGRE